MTILILEGNCDFILPAHLLFVTKYRGTIFRGELWDALQQILRALCTSMWNDSAGAGTLSSASYVAGSVGGLLNVLMRDIEPQRQPAAAAALTPRV